MRFLNLAMTLVAVASCGAGAFDGSKKGFVLGFGLGAHTTSIEEEVWGFEFTGDESGIATDFMIGYGFTPNFLLMYQNSNAWYTNDDGDLFYDAIGPVGIRYYLNGDEPGLFFGASAFLGSFVNSSKDAGAKGNGFGASVGYEFSKHYSVAAKFASLEATDGPFTHSSTSLQILFDAMAF